jgi:hypothetical protein
MFTQKTIKNMLGVLMETASNFGQLFHIPDLNLHCQP